MQERGLLIGGVGLLMLMAVIFCTSLYFAPDPNYDPKKTTLTDFRGLQTPPACKADEVQLDPSAQVVGVTVAKQSRAYLLSALSGDPRKHVINDLLGKTPVSVVHCDLSRCTRVLTDDSAAQPLDVRIGGWMSEKMQVLYGRRRYAIDSKRIPLANLTFKTTSWGEWKAAHPDTEVFLGEGVDCSQPVATDGQDKRRHRPAAKAPIGRRSEAAL